MWNLQHQHGCWWPQPSYVINKCQINKPLQESSAHLVLPSHPDLHSGHGIPLLLQQSTGHQQQSLACVCEVHSTLSPVPIAQPNLVPLHSAIRRECTGARSVYGAQTMLHPTLDSYTLRPHAQILAPSGNPSKTAQWYHPAYEFAKTPMKNCKSCLHWSITIIQHIWNTAWDLLTHHNMETYCWGPASLFCTT